MTKSRNLELLASYTKRQILIALIVICLRDWYQFMVSKYHISLIPVKNILLVILYYYFYAEIIPINILFGYHDRVFRNSLQLNSWETTHSVWGSMIITSVGWMLCSVLVATSVHELLEPMLNGCAHLYGHRRWPDLIFVYFRLFWIYSANAHITKLCTMK